MDENNADELDDWVRSVYGDNQDSDPFDGAECY